MPKKYTEDAVHPQSAGQQHSPKAAAHAKEQLEDIDTLIARLYEDRVLGSLSDDRYQNMTSDYEAEQERLKTEITVME